MANNKFTPNELLRKTFKDSDKYKEKEKEENKKNEVKWPKKILTPSVIENSPTKTSESSYDKIGTTNNTFKPKKVTQKAFEGTGVIQGTKLGDIRIKKAADGLRTSNKGATEYLNDIYKRTKNGVYTLGVAKELNERGALGRDKFNKLYGNGDKVDYTLVFEDYTPKGYNISKEEYNRRRKFDATLPEFGSYGYFKRREEELAKELKEISRDGDLRDDLFRGWAEEYQKDKNFTDNKYILDSARLYIKKSENRDRIIEEYKDIDSYLRKYGREGIHFDKNGEVDTRSGITEAKGNQKRLSTLGFVSRLTMDEEIDGYLGELPEEKQKIYDEEKNLLALADVEGEKASAYKHYEKNKDNEYKNTPGGLFKGSIRLGDIEERKRKADYASFTAHSADMEAGDVLDLLSERIQKRNIEALTPESKFEETVALVGSQIPQFVNQAAYQTGGRVIGGILGAFGGAAGVEAGKKIGGALAVAGYMYRQTAGAAFGKYIRETDLSVDDAVKLARNEALVSAGIEFGLTLAFQSAKVADAAAGGVLSRSASKIQSKIINKMVSTGISEGGAKKILNVAVKATKAAVNWLSEVPEEELQEGVSIKAENYAKEGKTASPWRLLIDTFDFSSYTQEEKERLKDSGFAALIVGGFTNATIGSAPVLVKKGFKAASDTYNKIDIGREIKKDGKVADVINEGLARDEKSKAFKSAQKLDNAKKPTSYALGAQAIKNEREIIKENEFLDALEKTTGVRQDIVKNLPNDVNGRFVSGGKQDGDVKYSIVENVVDSAGNRYDKAVLLDTDVFDEVSPRNWGRKLKEHIEKRVSRNRFIMPVEDENGNMQMLEFAGPNEKMKTVGENNRDVLSELYRTDDNISKLAVIHIDEIVDVSEKNNPYYTDSTKNQWLDENGWLHRNANVINKKNGNIYKLTFDIAKSSDGRLILYTTKGAIKKMGSVNGNSVAENAKGPGQNTHLSNSISQPEGNVKSDNQSERRKFVPRGRVEISEGATSIPRTIKHENTHAFKQNAPEAYKVYEDRVIEIAKASSPDAYNRAIEKIAAKYRAKNEVPTQELLREEIAAELTNEFLPNGAEDVRKIANKNPQEIWKITKAIKDAKAALKDMAGKSYTDKRTNIELSYRQLNELEGLYNQALYEAIQNNKNGVETTSTEDVRYSIDERFESKIEQWIKNKKPNGVRFRVGTTSKALKSIGVKEQGIFWDSSKINEIQKKHKEMGDGEIKQVPRILEKPIVVMQSRGFDSRVTIYADVIAKNEKPVMAVLELLPTNMGEYFILDEIKVVNAFGKDNPQFLLNNSDILYVEPNKERTDKWLVANRLQLPLHITKYGPLKRITYPAVNVKSKYSFKDEDGTNKASARGVSRQIIKEYNSRAELGEVIDYADDVFKLLCTGVSDDNIMQAMEMCKAIATEIADGMVVEDTVMAEMYDDLRHTIRTTRIKLSDTDKASLTGVDSFGEFRKRNFGKLIISNDGTPVDSFYQELSESYPNLFDADITHPADRLMRISEVYEELKPKEVPVSDTDKSLAVDEITVRLFNDLGNAADEYSKRTKGKSVFNNRIEISDYVDYAFEYAENAEANNRNPTIPKQKGKIVYGIVSERLKNDIINEYGEDISERVHVLMDNDIRHIRNSHGEKTNEKYPVTKEDIKQIPDIVENYDDVLLLEREDGKKGLMYVKRHNGITYYLEAFLGEKELTNKQMIKVSTGTIPDIKGLRDAINKKWSTSSSPNDKNIPRMYVPDVWKSHAPTNNIQQSEEIVKAISKQQDELFTQDAIEQKASGKYSGIYKEDGASQYTFLPQEEVTEAKLKEEYGVEDIADAFTDPVTRKESRRIRSLYSKENRINSLGSAFYTAVVDSYNPINNFVKTAEKIYFDKYYEGDIKNSEKHFRGKDNPYVLATNSRDAASRASYIVTNKLVDFDNNVVGDGLITILQNNGIAAELMNDFDKYLTARHAMEWLDREGHGAFKPVWGDRTLDTKEAAQLLRENLEAKHPEFKDAAEAVYEWQRLMMKTWLVDTGVITEEMYTKLTEMYPDYVPFFRENDTVSSYKKKTGFANQNSPIKKATGADDKVLSPIENIIYNVSAYVNVASRNEVMKSIVKWYDKMPSELMRFMAEVEYTTDDGRGYMYKDSIDQKPRIRYKGEDADVVNDATEEINISDSIQSIMNMDRSIVTVIENGEKRSFKIHDKALAESLADIQVNRLEGFLAFVAAFSRTRAALITSWNPAFAIFSNPLSDAQTMIVNSTDANKLKVLGNAVSAYGDIAKKSDAYEAFLAMGGEYTNIAQSGRDGIKKTLKDLKGKTWASKVLTAVPNGYNTLANTIETAPRLAEFKDALEKGYDYHEAFYRAKDVTTNFSRSGKYSKVLNYYSNFFNAAIQGIDKYCRQAKNNPESFAAGVAYLTVLELMTRAWNWYFDEEDDAENLSNYTKNNFHYLAVPGSDGKFITLKKGRESSVISSAIGMVIDAYIFKQEDRFKGFFYDYILNQFSPDISLVGASTWLDLKMNRSYTGAPIVPDALAELPKELQYDDNTSYLATALGKASKWVKDVTGIPLPALSPKQIDYFINNELGALGKINKIYGTPGSTKAQMLSYGLSDSYVRDSLFSTEMVNRFYDGKNEAEAQNKGYPSADNEKIHTRYEQAATVLSKLNGIYKGAEDDEQARSTRRLYVNYAKENKDNPVGYSEDVYAELEKLYKTDKAVLTMPSVDSEISATLYNEKREFSFTDGAEFLEYVKDVNKATDEVYKTLFASEDYKNATDEEKVKLIKGVRSDIAANAKAEYIEGGGRRADLSHRRELQARLEPTFEKVVDGIKSAVPEKIDGYEVSDMSLEKITSVTIDEEKYELKGEINKKVLERAQELYADNIERIFNNEVNIEDVIGYTKKGRAKQSSNIAGKQIDLTGKLYDSAGEPRYDELLLGKIVFRVKDAAIAKAAGEYAEEITGKKLTSSLLESKKTAYTGSSNKKAVSVAKKSNTEQARFVPTAVTATGIKRPTFTPKKNFEMPVVRSGVRFSPLASARGSQKPRTLASLNIKQMPTANRFKMREVYRSSRA